MRQRDTYGQRWRSSNVRVSHWSQQSCPGSSYHGTSTTPQDSPCTSLTPRARRRASWRAKHSGTRSGLVPAYFGDSRLQVAICVRKYKPLEAMALRLVPHQRGGCASSRHNEAQEPLLRSAAICQPKDFRSKAVSNGSLAGSTRVPTIRTTHSIGPVRSPI